MAIVAAEGLRKSFGDHEVLVDINLVVDRGEVVAIIGPSGSGKTTLLRCVNMLERPSAGRLTVDGRVLVDEANGRVKYARDSEIRASRVETGMVFQRFNLFPHMTVLENIIEAPMCVRRRSRAECVVHARDLLAQVGLGDKERAYPLQLSGGQQQRVAIARSLAMEPRLMLFDEVTSSVDPEMAGEILEVMRGLARKGMTMLVVTHEMGFAQEVADRVVFMDAGRVVEEGSPKSLLQNPTEPRLRRFLRAVISRVPMEEEEEEEE